MVADVLQHLSRQWGRKPPTRSEARHRVLATVHVAHGFDNVLAAIAGEAGDPLARRSDRGVDRREREHRRFRRRAPGARRRLAGSGDVWLPPSRLARVVECGRDPTGVGREPDASVGRRPDPRARRCVRAAASLPVSAGPRPLEGILLPTETQTSLAGGEVALVLPKGTTAELATARCACTTSPTCFTRRRISDIGEDFEIARFSSAHGLTAGCRLRSDPGYRLRQSATPCVAEPQRLDELESPLLASSVPLSEFR